MGTSSSNYSEWTSGLLKCGNMVKCWEQEPGDTVKPVTHASSSNYSEWKNDDKWSSQEWKSDEVLESRTGRPVSEQPPGLFTQHTDRFVIDDDDMDSNTAAKSGMSLKCRSFLHRVYDRVQKILDRSSKDAMQDNDKHSLIWGKFMSSTLQASVLMWKNYSVNLHSIKNTEDLTMKQMFDISEKLIVGQSDAIYGVTPINWEDSSWKHLSMVGGEKSHQSLREG